MKPVFFLQGFSNVASVCGPSSSPSALDDGENPCFDPAANTSALKMSFCYDLDFEPILSESGPTLNVGPFSQQCTSFTHVYYHNRGRSGKPDNLKEQLGVLIAASFGGADILFFFTTHFPAGTQREPALWRGANIRASTQGGHRRMTAAV